jgi:hypothetical protein
MVDVVGKMRGGEEPTYNQYASSFSTSLNTRSQPLNGRGATGARWMDSNIRSTWSSSGLGHRPTASVVEKIYSGE